MSQAHSVAGIILAAGKGTRMRSQKPKCMFSVCGLPMVGHVCRAMSAAGVEQPVVVVGHGGESICEFLGASAAVAWQHEQLGTGHATLQALPHVHVGATVVLVAAGDTPLLNAQILRGFLAQHTASGAPCSVATAVLDDATGYGRIVRNSSGFIERIVEQRDATDEERDIHEVNTGLYAFAPSVLEERLPKLGNKNDQGEYYLTDVVAGLASEGHPVGAIQVDPAAAVGVNDRWQLAEVERTMRLSILRDLAERGVTIRDAASAFIDIDVEIGEDSTIEPGVILRGESSVGKGSIIGPGCTIEDCHIGDDCKVALSHLVRATIGHGVKVGPYANLRPGTILSDNVKIGNFVEVKNALLGPGVAASHLAYLGDAEIGAESNIGAGTITCNYDGFAKHRTEIGSDVFVGSNSTLVAPLTIGDGAFVAAGSVVNKDVPADALALGRARQENKEGWVSQWRKRKR